MGELSKRVGLKQRFSKDWDPLDEYKEPAKNNHVSASHTLSHDSKISVTAAGTGKRYFVRSGHQSV